MHARTHHLPLIIAATVLAFVAHPQVPAQTYELIDLGTFGGNPEVTNCHWTLVYSQPYWDGSWATGVNNAGQVVGVAAAPGGECLSTVAFLWEDGELQMLDHLHDAWAFTCWASSINDSGIVIGSCWSELEILPGFPFETATMWQPDTRYDVTSLGFLTNIPPAPPLHVPGVQSVPNAINNAGVAVGFSSIDDFPTANHPFSIDVTNVNPSMTDVAPDHPNNAYAQGVNEKGEIVGYKEVGFTADSEATLWRADGTSVALPSLGGPEARALDINSSGRIVGWAMAPLSDNFNLHPTIWESGRAIDLHPNLQGISPHGFPVFSGAALAVNEHGAVVGNFNTEEIWFTCTEVADCFNALYGNAFLWQDGVAVALDDFIPDGSPFQTLAIAEDINDNGWIVGVGWTEDNLPHGFLLRPVQATSDLTGDGVVNAADLAVLLGAWSIPPSTPGCRGARPCNADLNHDGFVNAADLAILLGAWG